jgi:hypothetical protein
MLAVLRDKETEVFDPSAVKALADARKRLSWKTRRNIGNDHHSQQRRAKPKPLQTFSIGL